MKNRFKPRKKIPDKALKKDKTVSFVLIDVRRSGSLDIKVGRKGPLGKPLPLPDAITVVHGALVEMLKKANIIADEIGPDERNQHLLEDIVNGVIDDKGNILGGTAAD